MHRDFGLTRFPSTKDKHKLCKEQRPKLRLFTAAILYINFNIYRICLPNKI